FRPGTQGGDVHREGDHGHHVTGHRAVDAQGADGAELGVHGFSFVCSPAGWMGLSGASTRSSSPRRPGSSPRANAAAVTTVAPPGPGMIRAQIRRRGKNNEAARPAMAIAANSPIHRIDGS